MMKGWAVSAAKQTVVQQSVTVICLQAYVAEKVKMCRNVHEPKQQIKCQEESKKPKPAKHKNSAAQKSAPKPWEKRK